MMLTYDEKVEMLRLADDLAGGDVTDLDTPQLGVIVRALRIAAGETDADNTPHKFIASERHEGTCRRCGNGPEFSTHAR